MCLRVSPLLRTPLAPPHLSLLPLLLGYTLLLSCSLRAKCCKFTCASSKRPLASMLARSVLQNVCLQQETRCSFTRNVQCVYANHCCIESGATGARVIQNKSKHLYNNFLLVYSPCRVRRRRLEGRSDILTVV